MSKPVKVLFSVVERWYMGVPLSADHLDVFTSILTGERNSIKATPLFYHHTETQAYLADRPQMTDSFYVSEGKLVSFSGIAEMGEDAAVIKPSTIVAFAWDEEVNEEMTETDAIPKYIVKLVLNNHIDDKAINKEEGLMDKIKKEISQASWDDDPVYFRNLYAKYPLKQSYGKLDD